MIDFRTEERRVYAIPVSRFNIVPVLFVRVYGCSISNTLYWVGDLVSYRRSNGYFC